MILFNKKAVSSVVTSVLIILIVVVAVSLIGYLILNITSLSGSGLNGQTECLSLDVMPLSCEYKINSLGLGSVNVIMKSNSNVQTSNLDKIQIILEDSSKKNIVSELNSTSFYAGQVVSESISILESVTLQLNFKIIPYLKKSDGDYFACNSNYKAVECVSYTGRYAESSNPKTYSPNVAFNVIIDIWFDSLDCGAALLEMPPSGWNVTNISQGGSLRDDGTIVWAEIYGPYCGGQNSYTFSYTLTPPDNAEGEQSFERLFSIDGTKYPVLGNLTIVKSS